jgi:hypothetical protein
MFGCLRIFHPFDQPLNIQIHIFEIASTKIHRLFPGSAIIQLSVKKQAGFISDTLWLLQRSAQAIPQVFLSC